MSDTKQVNIPQLYKHARVRDKATDKIGTIVKINRKGVLVNFQNTFEFMATEAHYGRAEALAKLENP